MAPAVIVSRILYYSTKLGTRSNERLRTVFKIDVKGGINGRAI